MTRRKETVTPSATCVVVADAARARFFLAEQANGGLREFDSLVNPAGRSPERALGSDRPGRMANSAGRGGHSFGEHDQAHHEAVDAFARRIAQRMKTVRTRDQYGRLYLVAEPDVLGKIRLHLDAATRRCVAGEFPKSLTRRSKQTIRAALPDRL